MIYMNELKRSIGFIFILVITLVIMVGFSSGSVVAKPFKQPIFNSDNFPDDPDISNPFLTLIPETAFCYNAETEDGTELDEVTVTNCEQNIADVNTVVVRDAVFLDGVLIEDTYDYYAQDELGNVWYLGEASKECESGDSEGTWNADMAGAIPGTVMLADPMPGNSYQQEFLEGVAEDMGKVQQLNANVNEYCDKDCLKTKEWTPLEPGAIGFKYYAKEIAPGIGGMVLDEDLKGGKTVMSELVEVVLEDVNSGYCPNNLNEALETLCNEDQDIPNPPPMNCDNNE